MIYFLKLKIQVRVYQFFIALANGYHFYHFGITEMIKTDIIVIFKKKGSLCLDTLHEALKKHPSFAILLMPMQN